jgi:8-oxo-dGTP pyrophosphatase MutT (NUDIX family)
VRPRESTAPRMSTARTVLEKRIKDRRQTFEEFVSYAERFAREHQEDGTLSLRHLQRLAAGKIQQPSRLRPATVRLLERIFAEDIEKLLSPPNVHITTNAPEAHPLRVAIAVVLKGDQILVVSPRTGTSFSPWQFPAGIVKPGAASGDVAVQETLAETGIHCVPLRMLGARVHPETSVHCEYHRCEYLAGEARNLDPTENDAVTWIEISQLPRIIAPHILFPPLRADLGLTNTAPM